MAGTLSRFIALPLALCATTGVFAPAQQRPIAPDAGCVQEKGSYTCNWSSFKLALERAHTIGVETGPMDRSTHRQLNELVGELGKVSVAEGQPADLTMLLIPVDTAGINAGPSDHELATLRIYAPNEASTRGTLLWAETYRGQGDRPWPAQVHALVTQFEGRLPKH